MQAYIAFGMAIVAVLLAYFIYRYTLNPVAPDSVTDVTYEGVTE